MSPPFSLSDTGWRARIASPQDPSDNAALCHLVRSVRLRAALELTQERDPDFFVMPRMHLGGFESFLVESAEGQPVGCSTVIRRPGWLQGSRITTGYLGDLRVVPEFRGGRMMSQVYGAAIEWVRKEYEAEVFTTVIFDSNRQAKAALVQPGATSAASAEKRKALPRYREMTPFHMTSVQLTTRRPAPERPIHAARPEDREELFQFLKRHGEKRLLGDCVDEELMERRLSTWPGFSLGDFLLARNAGGRIVGCLAPWDTGSFKRTRVLGYHGRMAFIRRAYNLMAALRGFVPLPAPGECFRFPFLTHLEIEGDDPAILRDLLLAAYQKYLGTGAHFLSAMIPRGSKLEAAFDGFMVDRTAMTLYAVHARNTRFDDMDFRTQNPGFEMALS